MRTLWYVALYLAASLPLAAQTSAPAMRSLYVQDQRDRGVPLADNGKDLLPEAEAKRISAVSDADMGNHDIARRNEVMDLLRNGKLVTAEDFYDASFIFQHGQTADDYLLAHILAMDSMAKGNTSAKWIAAATLDRYLQMAQKKQVFGTQYLDAKYAFYLQHQDDKNIDADLKAVPDGQTQEPYDQKLLPDAIRADFCVPDLKLQTDYIAAANAGKTVDLPRLKTCSR